MKYQQRAERFCERGCSKPAVGRSFFKESAGVLENCWHTPQDELRKLCRINQVIAGFLIALFARSMVA